MFYKRFKTSFSNIFTSMLSSASF